VATAARRPNRRTLLLAVLFAVSAVGATGTLAASFFPGETDFAGSTFQTNALTGDPAAGITATPVLNSNIVNLKWTDAAATNFGDGDAQLAQWTNATHVCPAAATAYTFDAGSAFTASTAHTPADTVDPAGAAGAAPAGAWVCYAASIAYGQGAPGTWTAATPLWYGFAPSHTANAVRYGLYVSSILQGNTGTIANNTGVQVTYSQSTNRPAALAGLVVCAHRDAASGMTIVFFGYSGATCNFTPATAATAKTQFGYMVQTAGTTTAFATDKTATLGLTWTSATVAQYFLASAPTGGNVTETGTTWAYHVSATAPVGATQVKSTGSSSLVAENAFCPVATNVGSF
jgi:hypothetical protein